MYFSIPSLRRSRHPLVRAFSLLLGVVLVLIMRFAYEMAFPK